MYTCNDEDGEKDSVHAREREREACHPDAHVGEDDVLAFDCLFFVLFFCTLLGFLFFRLPGRVILAFLLKHGLPAPKNTVRHRDRTINNHIHLHTSCELSQAQGVGFCD